MEQPNFVIRWATFGIAYHNSKLESIALEHYMMHSTQCENRSNELLDDHLGMGPSEKRESLVNKYTEDVKQLKCDN